MKKSSIFMTALLSLGLVACNENFDPEVGPQTNLQESLLQASEPSRRVPCPRILF